MLIESENCKNVDFYDNKNMIVRNEINRALVHIDVIWYTCVFCQKEMGSAIGMILLYACFI